MFYKFLWNSGPDRIKRKIMVKNIACAGLRMVELKSFIKGLKVSWFLRILQQSLINFDKLFSVGGSYATKVSRRILQQSKPNELTNLSLINFDKLFSVGGSYATKVSHDLQNPFWKDLMLIWAEYCNILPVENIGHVLEAPLRYNEKIGRGKMFFKNWYENGIRVVQDIVSENGELYTFEQLKNIYNINGTFLDYQHLIHNIHPTWIIQINDNHVFILENKTNVICNIYIKNLIKAKKGRHVCRCKRIYPTR